MNTFVKIITTIVFSSLLISCMNQTDDSINKTPPETEENNATQELEGNNADQEPNAENELPEEKESSEENESDEDKESTEEVVLETEDFQIFEPSPDMEVQEHVLVRGLARVSEAIQYEFEDGHFIFDQGTVAVKETETEWGAFEFTIEIADEVSGDTRIVLYEESEDNDVRAKEVIIPVHVNQ